MPHYCGVLAIVTGMPVGCICCACQRVRCGLRESGIAGPHRPLLLLVQACFCWAVPVRRYNGCKCLFWRLLGSLRALKRGSAKYPAAFLVYYAGAVVAFSARGKGVESGQAVFALSVWQGGGFWRLKCACRETDLLLHACEGCVAGWGPRGRLEAAQHLKGMHLYIDAACFLFPVLYGVYMPPDQTRRIAIGIGRYATWRLCWVPSGCSLLGLQPCLCTTYQLLPCWCLCGGCCCLRGGGWVRFCACTWVTHSRLIQDLLVAHHFYRQGCTFSAPAACRPRQLLGGAPRF